MGDGGSIGGQRPSLRIVQGGSGGGGMKGWRRLVVRELGAGVGSVPAALFLLEV